MKETYYIKDLEQLRVFSEPFRIKILWSFHGKEKTGKMLADEFNIAPSKVRYHLVELERVGLIKVVRTELKNGIQQKFYLPVAESFSLQKVASLINGEDASKLDNILKQSALSAMDEMRKKLADSKFTKHQLIQIPYSIALTKQEKNELTKKIAEIYSFLEQTSQRKTEEPTHDYYLNITLFPIEEKLDKV